MQTDVDVVNFRVLFVGSLWVYLWLASTATRGVDVHVLCVFVVEDLGIRLPFLVF